MEKITELQQALLNADARWTAKESWVSRLTDEEKLNLTGLVITEDIALKVIQETRSRSLRMVSYDQEVDWRNRNGNFVTEVRNQYGGGTCASHSVLAVMESMALIEKSLMLDLSEADLHFCSSHGAFNTGWLPGQAIDTIKNRGVCIESLFPYQSAFIPALHCTIHPDRNANSYTIVETIEIMDIDLQKAYLTNVGPLTAALAIDQDFWEYSGGVYHRISGLPGGVGHAVAVIGYSESEQCWICKNSWSADWGDNGFFKIGYGESYIDNYPKNGVKGVNSYVPGSLVLAETWKSFVKSAATLSTYIYSLSAWTASSNVSWCTVTASGSGNASMNITVTENPETCPRFALISVVNGDTTRNILVKQSGVFIL